MRKSEKTLSIVIPAYNEERYLTACLDSVAAQTIQPDEVIVVNNNSTDKTTEIANTYSFTTVVHEKQQGLVYARTLGLNLARSEFVARIDPDVRLNPGWVEAALKFFETHPGVSGIAGRAHFYDVFAPRFAGWLQVLVYQRIQKLITGTNMLWGANMVIRKDAWSKAASNCHLRTDIDEDIDLTLALQSKHLTVAYEPALLVRASLRRDSIDIISTMKYLSTWPRDYMVNKKYLQAVLILLLTLLVVLATLPVTFFFLIKRILRRE